MAAERSALIAHHLRARVVQGFVYRRADAVTANARGVAHAITERLAVPPGRVHFLPNGIDLAEWDARSRAPSPIPLEPGRFHLALVGGLRAAKNHALLLDALALLSPAQRADLVVWFVGGETEGRARAEGIRQATAARGLESIVRLVPETPGIAGFIARIDAVVLPSHYEGFPNVLLEAMASGTLCVATSVGEVPHLVTGETGFVVPPGDAHALAAALVALRALPPARRDAMARRARSEVETHYGLDRVADLTLALYRDLAARREREPERRK